MEAHHFWAFFVIALIAGAAITLAISNATITGAQWWQIFRPREIKPPLAAVCGNGICEEGETYLNCPEDCPIPPTCFDSDGGKDYYVKGICTVGDVMSTDTCIGNVLREYYCVPGKCSSVNYNCTYGCWDGACKTAADCSDCQNVLDMLNKCERVTDHTGTYTCSETCQGSNRTCVYGLEVYVPPAPHNYSHYVPINCDDAKTTGIHFQLKYCHCCSL